MALALALAMAMAMALAMVKRLQIYFPEKDIKYFEYLEANRGRKSQSVFIIELIEKLMNESK